MHASFLLLPLSSPLLLIPNTSVSKPNETCDHFKKGEHLKKVTSQNNALDLFQDTGSCKANDNMLCKNKFSSVLSRHGMSDAIIKSTL